MSARSRRAGRGTARGAGPGTPRPLAGRPAWRRLAAAAAVGLLALGGCEDESAESPAAGAGGTVAPDESFAVRQVSPARVSARGGAEVTLRGAGFVEPVVVEIGGVAATVVEVTPEAVRLRAPRLPAGAADVRVTVDGEAVEMPAALVVEPLKLRFVPAPAEYVEAPAAGVVRDAAAFDVDADGDPDLVLATEDGLRVLRNDGAGRLQLQRSAEAPPAEADAGPPPAGDAGPPPAGDAGVPSAGDAGAPPGPSPARPGGRGDVRALAVGDLDGDGTPELLACTGAGRDVRFRGAITGLEEMAPLPFRAGGCRAAAFVQRGMLAFAIEEPPGRVGLFVLADTGETQFAFTPTVAPPPETPQSIDTATQSLSDVREGVGAARLAYTLTEEAPEVVLRLPVSLPDVPDFIRYSVRREGAAATLRVRIADGAGATVESEPTTPGPGWVEAEATFAPGPAAPIAEVALVVRGEGPFPMEGALLVDTVTAWRAGDMPLLVDDFERRAPRFTWPSVARLLAGDLDGDAAGDLVVLHGEGVTALASRPAAGAPQPAWLAARVPLAGPGPFSAGALLDADDDGDLDAFLASGAQDRLLVGDGWGRLLDATLGALPLDWSEARSIAVGDVDLDGGADFVVGNRGRTDRLYLARGDGRYLDATPDFGFDEVDTAAVVIADLDGDGDDDAVSVPRAGDVAPLVRVAIGEDE